LNSTSSPLSARRLAALLATLATTLLALGAAACGGAGGGNEDADPADIAPKGTLIYLSAFARPEGDQKEAVDTIAKKVFRVSDPGQRIQGLIDKEIKEDDPDMSFKEDIEPWLGKRIGMAVTRLGRSEDSNVAVIVASKDNDKAEDFIKNVKHKTKPIERSYKDVDYRFETDVQMASGLVDDYVVFGNETAFKAVVDASKDGDSLGDVQKFKSVADASEDKLGFGYVDVKALAGSLSSTGALPSGQAETLRSLVGTSNPEPVTMGLEAKSNQVTLDVTAPARQGANATKQQTDLVASLPGAAWVALGAPRIGQSLKQGIDQFGGGGAGGGVVQTLKDQLRGQTGLDLDRDILASLGDIAFFAQGTSILNVGVGAVVETPDPAAASRLVSKLGPLVRRFGGPQGVSVGSASVAGAKGLRVTARGLPGGLNVVTKGDRLVIAYGDDATRQAFSPTQKLADTPEFKQAQQSIGGALPSLYVLFGPLADLAASQSSADADKIRQYLGALSTLAAGSKVEGRRQVSRFVLNVK